MPLLEAKSLVGRSRKFEGYHVFEHNFSADLRVLRQLAVDCHRFSPIVGLEEDDPSSILMDVSGLTHLFGGDDGLRAHIHRHFQSLGYLVSTAIASTIGRAWGLARFADMSSDQAFDALPVQALRLQTDTVHTLQQLGITRVAHIRSLPRTGLSSRFGDEITRRIDQADGVIDEVIEAIHPPPDYELDRFLEYPVTDRNTIQVIVSRLVGQLCAQMLSAGRGGLVWQFGLRGAQAQQVQFTVNLFQPVASPGHLMPLVEMQMENLFRDRRATRPRKKEKQFSFQVQEVSVSVRNGVLLAERQRKLFDENPRLDKQALAHLVNRLSSRLGAESVVRPVLQSGVQVEDTFWFEPLVGQVRQRGYRTPRHPNAISPLQRPVIMHAQPVEIRAVAVDGTQHRTCLVPAVFVCEGKRLVVQRHWGPERIETAWWRGPTVRREYWRIETESGRWLWVYRNLQNHHWYLHGEF